jgi:hypothetical protein
MTSQVGYVASTLLGVESVAKWAAAIVTDQTMIMTS